jgi:hypothetical protein
MHPTSAAGHRTWYGPSCFVTLGTVKLRNRRLGRASGERCHDTAARAGLDLFKRAFGQALITDAHDNFAAP